MSRRAKIATLGALVMAFAIAGLLPFTLLALPNPPEYQPVEEVSERGAYLEDDGRLLRLYPHPEPADPPPGDAAPAGPEPRLQVKSRQFDELARYEIREVGTSRRPAIERFVDEDRILQVRPRSPLPIGEYVFESVEDSMYGEPEYYYFRVTRSGSGR